jgi:hypothetical protein
MTSSLRMALLVGLSVVVLACGGSDKGDGDAGSGGATGTGGGGAGTGGAGTGGATGSGGGGGRAGGTGGAGGRAGTGGRTGTGGTFTFDGGLPVDASLPDAITGTCADFLRCCEQVPAGPQRTQCMTLYTAAMQMGETACATAYSVARANGICQ